MTTNLETKSHIDILSKIIEWAVANEITITVSKFREQEGFIPLIYINLQKNGKTEYVRFKDWEELTRSSFKKAIEDTAFSLCLTRLEL